MQDASDNFEPSTRAPEPPADDRRDTPMMPQITATNLSSSAQAKVSAVTPDASGMPEQVRLETAAALYKASRLDEAEAIYRSVIERAPESYKALLGLGYLARDRDDRAAALAFFQAACAAHPKKTRPKLEAAAALRRLSRLDEAEALYRSVLENRPGDAKALAGLGRVAQARGNVRSALAAYQAAVASDPQSEDLKIKLASQLRKLSRVTEARRIYEDILARKPDHDVVRARLQALPTPRRSGLPPMEASWLKRPSFVLADEWGRNLEALGIAAFGMSLLTLAQDFAYGASEEVRPDCILIRRDKKVKILPLVSDWQAFDPILRREAAALPPGSILGYLPEQCVDGWTTRPEFVDHHREFVFHRETVAEMAGPSLATYRRQVRQLLKAGAYVEPIGPANLDRVLACNDRWYAGKKKRGRKTYYRGRTVWTYENLPLLEEQLGVRHLAVVLDDDVVAYGVASHIGASSAVFTFHRGDHEPWGVMPYLLREMARLYPDRQWINDGPAVRKPGLAWFKERFTSNAEDRQVKLGWLSCDIGHQPARTAESGSARIF